MREFILFAIATTLISFTYGNEYDFIVIGGGSSGAVIAHRLSEIRNWRILLLEAGPYPHPLADIPALAPLLQFTDYNWGYLGEKQTNACLGLTNQQVSWPRGKVLGGSSVINYMVATRGNRKDYDLWGENNPGWSYRDVLPYFIKMENSQGSHQSKKYHGSEGPLPIEDIRDRSTTSEVFIQAALDANHPYTDYDGKDQLGVAYVRSNSQRGRRSSTEAAYLRSIHRTNLVIRTDARVTKILIDPDTKEAYGVEYNYQRTRRVVYVSKEVILSAGALNSPQLLMISGIGPEDQLRELAIEPIQDLPVGQKLYDHLIFPGLVFQLNQVARPLDLVSGFQQWLWQGRGPLTSTAAVDAILFHATNEGNDRPDIELLYSENSLHSDGGEVIRKTLRYTDEIYNAIWQPLEGTVAVTVYVMLLHPKSYGNIQLKSNNPYHWPRFYANYLTDPKGNDIAILIKGIREAQRLMNATVWQAFEAQQVTTPIPGCRDLPDDSDAYWECALRHLAVSLYHQLGTCRMGPREDREAVVDHELRVHGIGKLRVADASVIPVTISGHTNLPSIMIGEKASDLIKDNWLTWKDQTAKTRDLTNIFNDY